MTKRTVLSALVLLVMTSMFFSASLWTAKAQLWTWNINPTSLPVISFRQGSFVYNGKVYMVSSYAGGGTESPNVYYADFNPDGTIAPWIETTPLPEYREQPATVRWNNYVYAIGGAGPVYGGRAEQDTVYYASINPDGTIGAWSTTTQLPERMSGMGVVVWDGRIYVAGGWNGYSRQNKVYFAEINEVDGTISSWYLTTSLPQTLSAMCAVVYNGTIYMIGGINSRTPQSSAYYAIINESDGTLGSWISTSSLPERRARGRCIFIGTDLYYTGGHEGMETEDWNIQKTIFKTTISTAGLGTWEVYGDLPEERSEHSLEWFNGRFYVMGGQDADRTTRDTIYYSGAMSIAATVDLEPNTLNLNSKGSWITAYIELPESYDVNAITVSSLLLNDTIAAELYPVGVGDDDLDGVLELMVKFQRADVTAFIVGVLGCPEAFTSAVLTVSGVLEDGTGFAGSDTITVLCPMAGGGGRPNYRR
jgi:N-acetylneuraminic acid mutarotase